MFSLEQYAAAHESAVMTEAPRGTIELTGADRRLFLHALLTNDIATLEKGTGAYAAYLTPQGRMISDMRVIETGERMLLDVEPALAAPLAERFNALIFSEDVQVADISAGVCVVAVHGPRAADVVERATGMVAADLASEYSNVSGPLTVVRDDGLGVPGFDIYVARADCESLRGRVGQAGAVRASDETIEALRIEAGRPRFGADMKTDTIPLEAGIENRAISFTKGCYVGQEVIVRVMHRGQGRVARRLVRLILPGSAVPNRGAKIFAGDHQVGEITSAAESPKAGAPMAMGYVHRDYAAPGTELIVNDSKGRVHQPGD